MTSPNPYAKIFNQYKASAQNISLQQKFLTLAINIGYTHNILGQMISQIFNLVGTIPFDQISSHHEDLKTMKHINSRKTQHQDISFDQKQRSSKGTHQEKYVPQRMEVQPFFFITPNTIENHQEKIIKSANVPDRLQETEQKPKHQYNQNTMTAADIYKEIFAITQKRQTQKFLQQSQRKGSNDSNDSISSKTQTAQIVRSNDNEKKLAAKDSFDELNYFEMEKDKKIKINVNQPKAEEPKAKKHKSPFFDLFDSSQTPSHQQSQNYFNAPQNYIEDIEIDKPYAYTQQMTHDSQNIFKKDSKKVYSPQNKKQKRLGNENKKYFQPTTNFLEITRWSKPVHKQKVQVEQQIDEIQSSEKKPLKRMKENQKNESKKSVQQSDAEYIPRREENGRKKSDRSRLQGSDCPDCKAFYDAIGDGSNKFQDMCKCTSRHKSTTTFMLKHKVKNFSQDFKLT